MEAFIRPEIFHFVSKYCGADWEIIPQEIPYYSMLFVEDGIANYVVNDTKYRAKKGDILFVKPGSSRMATAVEMTCIGIDFILPSDQKIDLPDLITWGDFEDFKIYFQDLKFEWLQQNPGFELKSSANLMLILHKLMFEKKQEAKNIHVELMKKYIMENHKSDLSVSSIAKVVSLSPVYCGSLFKKVENCTIAEFLSRVRINKAMTLLETGEYSVSETADECGFVDIYYFSNTFKKLVGVSPSKYKNSRNVKMSGKK